MDPDLARKKLLKALQALFASEAAFEEYGWELLPPEILIRIHPKAAREKKYVLRITFPNFPEDAPSYLWAGADAMPTMNAYKTEWPGFCLNGTKEFYTHGHPDRKGQWSPDAYPIASVLQEIQVELNKCI